MDLVNRKVTYRIYPTNTQNDRLTEMLGLHCRTYNAILEEHKRRHEAKLPYFNFAAMCKEITVWRGHAGSLDDLNAQSLQVTAKRAHLAFDAFFRRLGTGGTPGYPRFKSFYRYTGWGYKAHADGWRLFEGTKRSHSLRLSGVGDLKLRGKGRFSGIPKTCEILHKQGKWYVSVTFAVTPSVIASKPGKETGAFDWGLKNLLTIAMADGSIETVDNPKFLKKHMAALQSLQRVVSLEELKMKVMAGFTETAPIPEGTKLPRTHKLNQLYKQVGELHSKIARHRHDFYHKLSALLVSRFAFLASEELNVEKMTKCPEPIPNPDKPGEYLPNGAGQKAKLNRSILDAAPAKLLQMIATNAEEAGSWFGLCNTKEVKPTQRCHKCGTLVPKELSDRWHDCPSCGLHCDRDENAARTILRWFYEGSFWKVSGKGLASPS